jgi:hypothetical protein
MVAKTTIKMLTLTFFCILMVLVQEPNLRVAAQISGKIKISGLVNRPLNFTYTELLSFPMVSEVATLECIDQSWEVTLNWTGVPLFHLLTLAEVKPEASDVVFHATDDYSAAIRIEEALKPTTILALKANGTLLSEITGREGGFRIVVPCYWGLVWVRDIDEIEVRSDARSETSESGNYSDELQMPNCVPPSITPAIKIFSLPFGSRNFLVKSFTNISITAFSFNYSQKEINLNVTVPSGTTGFADLIVQQDLLGGSYTIFLEEERIDASLANVANLTFLYLTFPEGSHAVKIIGEKVFGALPNIKVEFNQTVHIGETAIFNASKSTDDGKIVSFEWNFGDGTNGNGAVISHSYTKEGTYQVMLNVTDNDDLHNFATLVVTVTKQQGYVPTVASAVLAIIIGSLMLILMILALKNRTDKNSPN